MTTDATGSARIPSGGGGGMWVGHVMQQQQRRVWVRASAVEGGRQKTLQQGDAGWRSVDILMRRSKEESRGNILPTNAKTTTAAATTKEGVLVQVPVVEFVHDHIRSMFGLHGDGGRGRAASSSSSSGASASSVSAGASTPLGVVMVMDEEEGDAVGEQQHHSQFKEASGNITNETTVVEGRRRVHDMLADWEKFE